MHLRLDSLDIGKRIGEADGSAGDGHGNVQKGNAESGAAALVFTGSCRRGRRRIPRAGDGSPYSSGLDSESARTLPEASMMVARAPAACASCAAISGREWARSVSTRWAKRRVFWVRLRSISVRRDASQAPPSMTSRVAAVAAMMIRKTARSLKKMRFFTCSSGGEWKRARVQSIAQVKIPTLSQKARQGRGNRLDYGTDYAALLQSRPADHLGTSKR